jgi:NAD(P)H-dependent FMN reductase
MRILGLCGSLQASSGNLTLLRSAALIVPERVQFEVSDAIRELPHFDPDLERDRDAPAPVRSLRAAIRAADALLIASPEYGHSLPGSLKNAIDWLIGSGELEGKIIGVTASVVHPERGRHGLDALLRALAAVSARVVGGAPIARGPDERQQLAALVGEIVDLVAADAASTVEP